MNSSSSHSNEIFKINCLETKSIWKHKVKTYLEQRMIALSWGLRILLQRKSMIVTRRNKTVRKLLVMMPHQKHDLIIKLVMV